MEEGLFPNARSVEETGRLEEERRLAYVGITRARQKLVLSYAESRRLHAQDMYGIPSRFLREIPAAPLHEVRPKVQVSRPIHAHAPPRNLRHAVGHEPPGIALRPNLTPAKFGNAIVPAPLATLRTDRGTVNHSKHGPKWPDAAP